MGLLVTLYLISANVYNSVSAPPGRGFSYIELWAVGMQIPLLLGTIHKLPTGCNSEEFASLLQSFVVAMRTLRGYTLYMILNFRHN